MTENKPLCFLLSSFFPGRGVEAGFHICIYIIFFYREHLCMGCGKGFMIHSFSYPFQNLIFAPFDLAFCWGSPVATNGPNQLTWLPRNSLTPTQLMNCAGHRINDK